MKIKRCPHCMSDLLEYGDGPCPYCGFNPDVKKQPPEAMRRNTILHGKYLVGDVLGQGGFGITYIGFDLSLESKVAIKEYYPSGTATRREGQNTLYWNSSHISQAYRQSAYDDFLKEARKMAKIDQIPSIVRVRETFLENETAYIVMDYVEGETLKARLKRQGAMPYSACYALLRPMMEGLSEVHKQGIIHRDISPDNIMVQPNGTVRLLDLGAAKDLTTKREGVSQLVTKKGFSPVEQYMDSGKIGPWTDVYALCATIYYACFGKMVPPSLERLEKDTLTFDLPAKEALSGAVVAALKKGLAVRPEDRIQTVEELLHQLDHSDSKKKSVSVGGKKPPKWAIAGVAAAAVLLFLSVFLLRGDNSIVVEKLGVSNAGLANYGGYNATDGYEYMIGADNALYLAAFDEEDQTFYIGDSKRISEFGSYINVSDDSVYFCYTDYDTCAIRRMNFDGSETEDIVTSELKFVLMQYVKFSNSKEYLYYIVCEEDEPYDPYGSLYRYDLAQNKAELLAEDKIFWFNLYGDALYTLRLESAGTTNNTILEKRALDGKKPDVLDKTNWCYGGFIEEGKLFMRSLLQETVLIFDTEGSTDSNSNFYELAIDPSEALSYGDGWVYYVNTQDNSIHRIRSNGTGDQVVIEGHGAAVICYSDYWLWFIEKTDLERSSYQTMQAYLGSRDGSKFFDIFEPDISWEQETLMTSNFTYELNETGDGYVITGYTGSATSLAIPKEIHGIPVVEIGEGAFKGSSVEQVALLPNLKKIGFEAFFDCDKLSFIGLPEGLEEIGDQSFGNCSSLQEVCLPDSLQSIGTLAFAETSLSSVYIPAGVTTIGDGAFATKANAGFMDFEVSSENNKFEALDGLLYQNNGIILLACPSGKEGSLELGGNTLFISRYAFAHCSALTQIEIPISVLWINENAFWGCSDLESIRITSLCEVDDNLGSDTLQVVRYEPTAQQKIILEQLRDSIVN